MNNEYPKIETLFNRDAKFRVIEGEFRLPEFKMINEWYVTEKVDGTNVRIIYEPLYEKVGMISLDTILRYTGHGVRFAGKTDKAEFHPDLSAYLEKTFTYEKLSTVFPTNPEGKSIQPPHVIIYGEGYGPKIQSGGTYRKDIAVRVFDVFIADPENPLGGWWLEPENITDIAAKLGVNTVTKLPVTSIPEIVESVKNGFKSQVAHEDGDNDALAEGIVARTKPLLFTRKGERLIWKLKTKDFNPQKARSDKP